MVDVNSPELQSSWEDLTDSKSETNWIIWGYSEDGKSINFESKGTGGLKEFIEGLDESAIKFGAFKVEGVDVRENVTSVRPKFIAVSWIGPNVSALKKAKVSVHKQGVVSKMQGITLEVQTSDPSDLDQKDLANSLLRAGGAHKPTSYNFGPEQEYQL